MLLRGSLREVPLIDVLLLVRRDGQSGVCVLEQDAHSGLLMFRHGRPLSARIFCHPQRQAVMMGDDALRELLTWDSGVFAMRRSTNTAYTVTEGSVRCAEKVIIENQRSTQRRIVPHSAQRLGVNTRLCVTNRPIAPTLLPCLEAQHWAIIRAVGQNGGCATAGVIARTCGVRLSAVQQYIVEMLALDLLEERFWETATGTLNAMPRMSA